MQYFVVLYFFGHQVLVLQLEHSWASSSRLDREGVTAFWMCLPVTVVLQAGDFCTGTFRCRKLFHYSCDALVLSV